MIPFLSLLPFHLYLALLLPIAPDLGKLKGLAWQNELKPRVTNSNASGVSHIKSKRASPKRMWVSVAKS